MTAQIILGEPGPDLDEPIDVERIRLSHPARATALLSEFWSADRVLAAWAAQPDCRQVHFEVIFCDGLVVRGAYAHFKNGKRCKPFGAHVRSLLHLAVPGLGEPGPGIGICARYVVPLP